jgi:hypothetical protein
MRVLSKLSLSAGLLLGLSACDYSGDWLFAGAVDGIPGVVHLGTLEPVDLESGENALADHVVYGEVGPSGTSEQGGVTFDFVGNGESVCVWADPELLHWNQSVSPKGGAGTARWRYPDNHHDDGDLDLFAGLSVFYTGAPGERLGSFVVELEDDLGNNVNVSLSECLITGYGGTGEGHQGRGMPEYCTLNSTQPGVSYTVMMQTFSTPLDDDVLGYGVLLAQGTCQRLIETNGVGAKQWRTECLVEGEAIVTGMQTGAAAEEAGLADRSWLGASEVSEVSWPGSVNFERAFCDDDTNMGDWCAEEVANAAIEGKTCYYGYSGGPYDDGAVFDSSTQERCYCGNPDDTPTGGAF